MIVRNGMQSRLTNMSILFNLGIRIMPNTTVHRREAAGLEPNVQSGRGGNMRSGIYCVYGRSHTVT